MSAIEINGIDRIDEEESGAASGNAVQNAAATVICADIGISKDLLNDEQTELFAAPGEKDSGMSTPPPPPPTPVYAEVATNVLEEVVSVLAGSLEVEGVSAEKSDDEQWATPCAPSPPPPVAVDRQDSDNEFFERQATTEDAEAKLDNGKESNGFKILPEQVTENEQKSTDVPEDANMTDAMPLREPVSSEPLKASKENGKPSSIKAENNDEELLSLHVLSARSSTPYTQPIACTSVTCELEHISEIVSPVKEDIEEKKAHLETGASSSPQKHRPTISQSETALRPISPKPLGKSQSFHINSKKLRYDRAHLMRIRNDVPPPAIGESVKDSMHAMQAYDYIEVEMQKKLRNFNILKWSDQDGRNLKLKARQNEMMPSFYKRKYAATMDESIIKSYPPQPELKDPAVASNQRRIGSGRVQQNKFAYQKTPSNTSSVEKLLWKEGAADSADSNLHSQPFQSSSQATFSKVSTGWEPKMTNGDKRAIKANYVRPIKSGFLFINEPKIGGATGRHRRDSRDHNEEPEWFSAGPTSRLDTIELHGFEEDERAEKSENEADNNNNANPKANSEVEHAAGRSFQFDEFAAAANQRRPHNNAPFYQNVEEKQQYRHAPNTDSKFLPFFGGTQPLTCEELEKTSSSSSLNDFFKKALSVQPQPEKKEQHQQPDASANAIFFADQLEAKWRRNSLTNNDANNNNLKRDTENFQKLMGHLNNNEGNPSKIPPNPYGIAAQSRAPNDNIAGLLFAQQQAQQAQQMLNQKQNIQYLQQQQAANLANFLQMRAILNRPEAQSLLLRLQKGEISKYGLVVQLSNPNLPKSDREAMTAVLSFASIQQQQKQQFERNLIMNQLQNLRNLAIVQQTVSAQQQQQQPQSPAQLQGQGLSANELRTHTNLVLQNAVLNRKREEQQNLGMQNMLRNANQAHTAGMNLQSPTSPGTHGLPPLQSLFNNVQNMQTQPQAPRHHRGNYLNQRRRFHGNGGSQMKFNLGADNQQHAMNQQNRIWNGMNAPRHQPTMAFNRGGK